MLETEIKKGHLVSHQLMWAVGCRDHPYLASFSDSNFASYFTILAAVIPVLILPCCLQLAPSGFDAWEGL